MDKNELWEEYRRTTKESIAASQRFSDAQKEFQAAFIANTNARRAKKQAWRNWTNASRTIAI